MASPVVPAQVEPTGNLDAVLASGDTSVPESVQPAQTTEAPQPQEASAPEQGQQVQPADTSSPAPNYDSKEFKNFLARYGGDPEKAAKAFFDTDTRASEMARVLKANGIDPVTLKPTTEQGHPAEAPVPPEQPPVELDAAQIDQHVLRALDNDHQAVNLTSDFNRIDLRLKAIEGDSRQGIAGEATAVEQEIRTAELRLKIPEVAEDSFRKAEVTDQLRELRSKLSDLKAERRDLRAEKQDVVGRYSTLANRYREQIRGQLSEEVRGRQERAAFEAAASQHEQQFRQQWPNALEQAVKTHKIPTDLVDKFKVRARKEALAFDGPIEDIPEFVESFAKEYSQELDTYHRAQSAVYGAQAIARASTPGPSGGAAVAPNTHSDAVPTSEADLMKQTNKRFDENFRAAVG